MVSVGGTGLGVTVGVFGVLVGGIGVMLGTGVLLGTLVLVGVDVAVGTGVLVGDGVIDGVLVLVGVKDGAKVAVGSGVLVGGGGGDGVGVVVAVAVAVQVTIDLGTAFLIRLHPLSKIALTPKSELMRPVNGPPPPQSLSKSISQRYWVPALNGTVPFQIDDEE